MKIILPIVYSLLLIGCSDSTKTEVPVITKAQNTVAPVVIKSPDVISQNMTPPSDGELLFVQKCVSCHGMKGEKSALGKSQIIANLTEKQIKDALIGYQEGTYGKEMKGLMQGQVKALELEQIDALAKHIATL